MLKCAIFDFDGTLFDSMYVWETAGEDYLRSIGLKARNGLREDLRPLSLRGSAEYIREEYNVSMTVEEIMDGINRCVEDNYLYRVQPKVGAVELLEKMKAQGIRMCIATATDRYQIEAALKRCGMGSYFSEIFTCTDVGHGKDEPIIYRKAMELLGGTRADTAVFEDSDYAVKTAKNDGFITVAIYDTHARNSEEIKRLADVYVEDLRSTDILWEFFGRL